MSRWKWRHVKMEVEARQGGRGDPMPGSLVMRRHAMIYLVVWIVDCGLCEKRQTPCGRSELD